jgi:hypothetical protein
MKDLDEFEDLQASTTDVILSLAQYNQLRQQAGQVEQLTREKEEGDRLIRKYKERHQHMLS